MSAGEKTGINERAAAITSGKNSRDRPLYVQVREGDSSLWYVIKDGRQQQEEEEKRSDADDDDIIFQRLALPQLGYHRIADSLVVINSKLFLIGGDKITNKSRRSESVGGIQYLHGEPVKEYEYLDLKERRLRWRRQPFRQYPYTQNLASCKDGLIYGFGPHPYILDPALRFGKLDTPMPRITGEEHGRVPQPLAMSNNKVYAYSLGPNFQHYLFSYDMDVKKWECLFKNFWGDWATGVVLSGDSYLIAYGSRHPIEWKKDKPGVWVFDIRRRQWLDEPVKGLDEALPVIPDWAYVDWERGYVYYLPRLFEVGTQRFALLWEESDDESYKLHCHKFTLQAPASTDQPFVAQQLSNKATTLNGGNNKILGCTVGWESEQGRED